ncbi:PQQ-like beta-propeller repeat protein [candidate division KSB1 bacterium]|nr:PQQ-like beta-propeller repeat protein [candidate division KSB1 bacterium]
MRFNMITITAFLCFNLLFFLDVSIGGESNPYAAEMTEWVFQTDNAVYATPLVHDNIVYIGSLDKNFYAIDALTGEKKWSFATGSPVQSNAAINAETVCFEAGNKLYGLDLQGNFKWQVELAPGSVTNQYDSWDFFHSSPVFDNGIAYIGSERGWIVGVDVASGIEVWRVQIPTKVTIRVAPAISGTKLLAGDGTGIRHAGIRQLCAGETYRKF